jgi:hypothetical protein
MLTQDAKILAQIEAEKASKVDEAGTEEVATEEQVAKPTKAKKK